MVASEGGRARRVCIQGMRERVGASLSTWPAVAVPVGRVARIQALLVAVPALVGRVLVVRATLPWLIVLLLLLLGLVLLIVVLLLLLLLLGVRVERAERGRVGAAGSSLHRRRAGVPGQGGLAAVRTGRLRLVGIHAVLTLLRLVRLARVLDRVHVWVLLVLPLPLLLIGLLHRVGWPLRLLGRGKGEEQADATDTDMCVCYAPLYLMIQSKQL